MARVLGAGAGTVAGARCTLCDDLKRDEVAVLTQATIPELQ